MTPVNRIALAIIVATAGAAAQSPALPPVRTLGPAVHVSKELLARVTSASPLAHGRILINDVLARRLILFDSTLAALTIIADSASSSNIPYGARPGGLIKYLGDSVVFIDPASLAMLVFDHDGNVARVMSVPRPDDVALLTSGRQFGIPGFDASGRLIYRGQTARIPINEGEFFMSADSAPIVRYDFNSRKLDTLTKYRIAQTKGMRMVQPSGSRVVYIINNPLPATDDWTVLPDGSLAVIRGNDYHVDWWRADGTRASTSKIAFEWHRLTDSIKIAFIDSVRAIERKSRAEDAANQPRQMGGASVAGGSPAAGSAPAGGIMPPVEDVIVQPDELPDYAPPFASAAARADIEGNVWVKTSFAIGGGSIYDIINSEGALIDRVSLPMNRAIAGFGPGVVYLGVRDGEGARLEVVKIR